MAHAYRSLEPGEQIIISDDEREDLAELARWESITVSEAKAILKRQADEAAKAAGTPAVPLEPTDAEKAAEAEKVEAEAKAKAEADAETARVEAEKAKSTK